MELIRSMQISDKNMLQKTYYAFSLLYLCLFPWLPWGLAAILKPLPIVCLLFFLILQGKTWTGRNLLFFTLSFAMLGDILLALPSSKAFMIGMICFIIMHCGYCIQFMSFFRWQKTRTILMLFICCTALCGYRFLYPSLHDFAIPALLYLGFLLSMVFFALHAEANKPYLFLGGILFFFSDSLLGFNEFMLHRTALTLLVMTSYYLSQWYLFLGAKNLQKD